MSDRMNILVTNDDGYDSDGISALFNSLSKVADVFMLAPDRNRSAVSSIITMNAPLAFRRIDDVRYSCSGYPVDCVISALRSNLFPVKFDAVFSGINRGPNMGTDAVYSGTIAAARQAVLYGVPGIALSLESSDGSYDYRALADFAASNIKNLVSLCKKNVFLSVNALSAKSYSSAELTSLCVRNYRDKVDIVDSDDGTKIGYFSGGDIVTTGSGNCEYFAVQKGLIAVSRLLAEPAEFTDTEDSGFDFEL